MFSNETLFRTSLVHTLLRTAFSERFLRAVFLAPPPTLFEGLPATDFRARLDHRDAAELCETVGEPTIGELCEAIDELKVDGPCETTGELVGAELCETVDELKVGEPSEAVGELLGAEVSEAVELSTRTRLEAEERVRVLSLLAVSRPLLPILPLLLVLLRLLPGLLVDTRFLIFVERESLHDVVCCTAEAGPCECKAPLTLPLLMRLIDDSDAESLRRFFDAPLLPVG